jgi:hypothetical protein
LIATKSAGKEGRGGGRRVKGMMALAPRFMVCAQVGPCPLPQLLRSQVGPCVAACAKALAALKPEALTADVVHALYADVLTDATRQQLQDFAKVCTAWLLAQFGDVPATLASDELRGQFGALPVEAAAALACSDDLCATSENDVLVRASVCGGGGVASARTGGSGCRDVR